MTECSDPHTAMDDRTLHLLIVHDVPGKEQGLNTLTPPNIQPRTKSKLPRLVTTRSLLPWTTV
jgi:hypothetical protein